MKVFILEHYYDYEGSKVLGIYSTLKKAQEQAKVFIEKDKKEFKSKWRSHTRGYVWRTNGEGVSISPMELEP